MDVGKFEISRLKNYRTDYYAVFQKMVKFEAIKILDLTSRNKVDTTKCNK